MAHIRDLQESRFWPNVASALVLFGLTAQGTGVYFEYSPAVALIVTGTELACFGLLGVVRRAR